MVALIYSATALRFPKCIKTLMTLCRVIDAGDCCVLVDAFVRVIFNVFVRSSNWHVIVLRTTFCGSRCKLSK